ncbi:MAG: ImmA/IrrE family metallo-endopeptidase [Actinomycetota bacterium]|nr:ImmA/IrrE family metallo-endopeptidase [Actinomycetota bacterium]
MEDRRINLNSITAALLAHVGSDAEADLLAEDPCAAVEMYFSPIAFQALPTREVAGGECSTDGYYDPHIDPALPWIIYADDVHERRVRFTILHELGHHLLATAAAALLDDLDQLSGSSEGAVQAEEAVCHRFAGHLLVPDQAIHETLGTAPVVPEHVRRLHDSSGASWEAVAIRVAEAIRGQGAVVLVRDGATVSFSALAGPGRVVVAPWEST